MYSKKQEEHYPISNGFVVLPDDTIRSNQFKSLTPTARCIYLAILTEYKRDKKDNPNNELTISHDKIEEISGLAHSTVVRDMRELKDKGFIKVKQKGSFRRHISTYIINGRYTHSGCQEARW